VRKLSSNLIIDGNGEAFPQATLIIDENGRIIDFLKYEKLSEAEHFDGIITPGFINSHCHTELSHLIGKVAEKTGLHNFILEIEKQRKSEKSEILEAAVNAVLQMKKNGIVAVGDICNSQISKDIFEKEELRVHRFIELFAFLPERANYVFEKGVENYHSFSGNRSITLHAPYSASDNLIGLVSHWAMENNGILSIHNQESFDENLLFKNKTGKILERLKLFGIDTDFWKESGKNSLETTLEKLALKEQKIMLVHNTFSETEDIDFAEKFNKNIFWCLCPNANIYIEDRLPNINLLREKNCKIVLGTDSLASTHKLDILEEMKTISREYPKLVVEELVKWACGNAANFFNWPDLGTFVIGAKPGINLILNTDNQLLRENSSLVKLY
jgi:aminodeoxyfutalosine deaminase